MENCTCPKVLHSHHLHGGLFSTCGSEQHKLVREDLYGRRVEFHGSIKIYRYWHRNLLISWTLHFQDIRWLVSSILFIAILSLFPLLGYLGVLACFGSSSSCNQQLWWQWISQHFSMVNCDWCTIRMTLMAVSCEVMLH